MKIITLGNPILREKARPVSEINGELKTLIEKMADLMYRVKGLGLAANQVGIPERFLLWILLRRKVNPSLRFTSIQRLFQQRGKPSMMKDV